MLKLYLFMSIKENSDFLLGYNFIIDKCVFQNNYAQIWNWHQIWTLYFHSRCFFIIRFSLPSRWLGGFVFLLNPHCIMALLLVPSQFFSSPSTRLWPAASTFIKFFIWIKKKVYFWAVIDNMVIRYGMSCCCCCTSNILLPRTEWNRYIKFYDSLTKIWIQIKKALRYVLKGFFVIISSHGQLDQWTYIN